MFAREVAGDEVAFLSCSYRDLLAAWSTNPNEEIRQHAFRISERFSPVDIPKPASTSIDESEE
jgi:hypothetical protein